MQKRGMMPVLFAALAAVLTSPAIAANPSGGTLSPATPAISYTGGPYTGSNPSNQLGDPDCSLVPNTCDDYALTVDVDAVYLSANPNAIVQIRVEWPGPSDFDLYLQDPVSDATLKSSGELAGMPEVISFSAVEGIHQYRVRTLVFAAVNETFTGTVRLLATPPVDTGAVAYVTSGDVFTCNKHLEGQSVVFDHGGDGEPAVAIDKDGNTWITGIAGVGGGIGLWKFAAADVCAQSPTYLDNPDAGAGGGDTDIAIAPEKNALGNYNIYTSSLSLANVTSSTSLDGGNTFVLTPISTPSTVNDRQWNATYGVNTIYLSFNIGATQPGQVLELYRSPAAGAAGTFLGPYLPRGAADPQITYGLGNLAVDQRPGGDEVTGTAGADGEGNVYQGYHQNDGNEVWMAVSRDFGVTWTQSLAFDAPTGVSMDHKFTWVAVDGGGNVYTCWSDDHNVYYSVSQDIKTSNTPTWSPPRRVNNGALTKTCVLPMMEAGSSGRVVFAWYGTDSPSNATPGAQYHYFHARCNNATGLLPVIEQVKVSDHVVHTGIVCQDGLGCGCCRELLECQELAVNPLDGSSLVTYAGAGGIHVTHEVAGASAIDGKTITDNSGPCPALTDDPPCVIVQPPSSACILPGTRVATDPNGDVTNPLADPVQHDIEGVWFAEPWLGEGVRELIVTLKVAGLGPTAADLPINTLWTVLWSNPVPGDPFPTKFVQMNTCDVTASPSFAYGHVEGTIQTQDGSTTGSWSSDGTIEVHINPALVGNPQVNQLLGSTVGEVRLLIGALCSGSIQTLDNVSGVAYKVQGNDYCRPHTVTCAANITDGPGDYPVQFVIHNPSTASRLFAIALQSAHGWLVGGTLLGPVGPVSPNSSISIPAIIRMPGDCTPASDVVDFQAAAMDLPPPDNADQCATTATCENVVAVGDHPNGLTFSLVGSNPFHGRTQVSYSIPARAAVRIEAFNVAGQRVRTLVNEVQEAGAYSASFSLGERRGAQSLGAGVYLVRITVGEWSRSMRLVALH